MGSTSILLLSVVLVITVNKRAVSYHCDFEEGTCGWENDEANDVGCRWGLRKGFAVTPDSGPFADHTYGTPNGTYLYFQSGYCRQAANNGLVGVNLAVQRFTQKSICVKFWYQMYGDGIEYALSLQKKEKQLPPAFISAGNRGRTWRFAQVSIEQSSPPYSLTFLVAGGMPYADVALDDIDIVDGQCEPAVDLCDFERGDLCGFTVTNATEDFQWNNIAAGYFLTEFYMGDHTLTSFAGIPLDKEFFNKLVIRLATAKGNVAYAFSSDNFGDVTSMVSPVTKSLETEQCLTFYYMLLNFESGATTHARNPPLLSVYILTNNQPDVTPVWSAVGGNTVMWEYATIPISLKEPYQYSFVAWKKKWQALFLLDDISVYGGPCQPKLNCNFTNGSFCDWVNSNQHGPLTQSYLGWMANEPYPAIWTGAPSVLGRLDEEGGFLFLDSKYTVTSSSDSEEATLLSQRFSSTTTRVRCFSFSYRLFLEGNAEPGLYVVQYLVAGEGDRNLFSAGNSTGGMWVNVELDIKPDQGKDFYLAVTGKVATSAADHTRIDTKE